MLEIVTGLGIIILVFGFVLGLMVLAEGGYDYPKWLSNLAFIVVVLIAIALLFVAAYFLGATLITEFGW